MAVKKKTSAQGKKATSKKRSASRGASSTKSSNKIALLAPVAKSVRLQGLRFVSFEAHSDDDGLDGASSTEDFVGYPTHSGEWQLENDGEVLVVHVNLGLEMREDGPSDRVVAYVRGRVRLDFAVKPGESFDPEQLDAFALVNGAYNAWPYWREFVQSSMSRLDFIGPLVPTFRPELVV